MPLSDRERAGAFWLSAVADMEPSPRMGGFLAVCGDRYGAVSAVGAFWLFAVADMEPSPRYGAFWLFAVADMEPSSQ
jgi:hypothetical protein